VSILEVKCNYCRNIQEYNPQKNIVSKYPSTKCKYCGKYIGVRKTFIYLFSKKIRDNLSQSAGWLIMLGAIEYDTIPVFEKVEKTYSSKGNIKTCASPKDWQVGAFEPTTGLHGDIKHLYVVDLKKKEAKEIPQEEWEKWEK